MHLLQSIEKLGFLKKKHIETMALFFYTTILLIPLIFIFLKKYKLARIKSERVGHLVSETFTIRNDVSLRKFKVIFLIKKNKLSNPAYVEMFKLKHGNTFIELPNFIYHSFRLPKIFMVDVDQYVTTDNAPMKSYNIYANLHTIFNKSDLPQNSTIEYKRFLKLYKIKNSNKIVVLHLRSNQSNFLDNNQHSPRNVNPETYSSMVNFLCNKGFFVVRIGDPDVYIKVKNKNYINYAKSIDQSSHLDLALSANCSFVIGCSSGAVCIAASFGKPILALNMCLPFNYSPCGKPNEIGVPKLIRNKKTNKILSLKEIYDSNIYRLRSAEDTLLKEYEFVDNDDEDLTNAAQEMVCFFENKCFRNKKYLDINNLIRSQNKNFDVDAGSLSNFSISFYKKHCDVLLRGISK